VGRHPPLHAGLPQRPCSRLKDAGRLDEAITLYERTLADFERVLGDTHPDTLASRNNLADAYLDAGRLDQAESLRDRWA
jgi:tetratricopeptide (TPR) repeat protein